MSGVMNHLFLLSRPCEVVVEKFGMAAKIDPLKSTMSTPATHNINPTPLDDGKWIKVIRKRRSKISPAKSTKKKLAETPSLTTEVAQMAIVVDKSLEVSPPSGTPFPGPSCLTGFRYT